MRGDAHAGELAAALRRELRGDVRADAYTRHLFSGDASMYAREPLLVAFPRDGDDVAAAIALAAVHDLPGAYNLAADGWLSVEDVARLLGRRILEVPEQVALTAVGWLFKRGLSTLPPAALDYLMHPWVVTSESLHAHGWAPTTTNRQALRAFAVATHAYRSYGRVRIRRRDIYLGALSAIGLLVTLGVRRWRRG